ncbi:small multidrug resistance pump [Erwinia persicina]|jgi:small multidrug resistance pump|uniref:Multidrug efflux SMR transporter n=2 Tax=Erwinia TaxID=551 RepID=A0ABV4E7Y0_9GAMM|nr:MULTISPECIES: SMR family transporter [Erwinia]MCP1438187.1 small multidrug resistance pump [Erwinia persicina]MDN4626776.1 SMR family transporter [Erwinia sp. PsM31]MDN8543154.1 SMR family transporter [Erwinia sp. BC051422]
MHSTLMGLLWLFIAILLEVLATSLLPKTDNFKRWGLTLGVMAIYGTCFYALSKAIVVLSVGLSYALWAGLGVVIISLVGVIFYRNKIDKYSVLGIGLIGIGCITMGIF